MTDEKKGCIGFTDCKLGVPSDPSRNEPGHCSGEFWGPMECLCYHPRGPRPRDSVPCAPQPIRDFVHGNPPKGSPERRDCVPAVRDVCGLKLEDFGGPPKWECPKCGASGRYSEAKWLGILASMQDEGCPSCGFGKMDSPERRDCGPVPLGERFGLSVHVTPETAEALGVLARACALRDEAASKAATAVAKELDHEVAEWCTTKPGPDPCIMCEVRSDCGTMDPWDGCKTKENHIATHSRVSKLRALRNEAVQAIDRLYYAALVEIHELEGGPK